MEEEGWAREGEEGWSGEGDRIFYNVVEEDCIESQTEDFTCEEDQVNKGLLFYPQIFIFL